MLNTISNAAQALGAAQSAAQVAKNTFHDISDDYRRAEKNYEKALDLVAYWENIVKLEEAHATN